MLPYVRIVAIFLTFALTAQVTAAADTFTNIKLVVNAGDKGEEQEATLRFEDEALVVRSKGGTLLKTFPYADIKTAEYSYAKSPRWKSGIGLAVAVGVFALPVFFMKGKKHWLTVTSNKDFAVLRLDKNNYKLILPAVEVHTGKKVETATDEK
jgi:hypothetical protein